MILGLDDILGGETIFSFLIWVILTGLYYLVCYLATLNVLDDLTRNSWLKFPALILAAVPSAGLMAVFSYKPYIFSILILFANYFRVKNIIQNPKWTDFKANPTVFYLCSYSYIILLTILAFYFPSLDFSQ